MQRFFLFGMSAQNFYLTAYPKNGNVWGSKRLLRITEVRGKGQNVSSGPLPAIEGLTECDENKQTNKDCMPVTEFLKYK